MRKPGLGYFDILIRGRSSSGCRTFAIKVRPTLKTFPLNFYSVTKETSSFRERLNPRFGSAAVTRKAATRKAMARKTRLSDAAQRAEVVRKLDLQPTPLKITKAWRVPRQKSDRPTMKTCGAWHWTVPVECSLTAAIERRLLTFRSDRLSTPCLRYIQCIKSALTRGRCGGRGSSAAVIQL